MGRKVLEGIRVLDMSEWVQGPQAAAMLGDLGADVIDWRHDAVVFNNSRECRGTSAANQLAAAGLRANGIPAMYYEGSTADPEMLDQPRYMADMDALLESMGLKPIHDYTPVEPPDYNEF